MSGWVYGQRKTLKGRGKGMKGREKKNVDDRRKEEDKAFIDCRWGRTPVSGSCSGSYSREKNQISYFFSESPIHLSLTNSILFSNYFSNTIFTSPPPS